MPISLITWLGIWYIKNIFSSEPALILTESGFYDNSEPWSPGWVPWTEVGSITNKNVLFWKVTVMKLISRDGIVKRQKNIIKKICYASEITSPYSEIRIRSNILDKTGLGIFLSKIPVRNKNESLLSKEGKH